MEFNFEDIQELEDDELENNDFDDELKREMDSYENEALEKIAPSNKKTSWYKIITSDGSNYFTCYPKGDITWSVAEKDPDKIINQLKVGDPDVYDVAGYQFLRRYIDSVPNPKARVDSLPSGVYNYVRGDNKPDRLEPLDLREEAGVDVHKIYDNVNTDIVQFLENKEIYDQVGMLYKLGILMYGAPGNGKSLLIRRILSGFIKDNDAVVIYIGADFPRVNFIQHLKNSLEGRLKVFVFEELSINLGNHYLEQLLKFLDGEESLADMITLATTNYPENLPGNIVNRPARFDKLYKFDNPDAEQRRILLEFFFKGRDFKITEKEIDATKNLSIAGLREVFLSAVIGKKTILEAVKTLNDRSAIVKKGFSEEMPGGVGFDRGY